MARLTAARCNGIKDGYWSPSKKEELVQRLALYENIDPDPDQLRIRLEIREGRRIPQRVPDVNAGYKIIASEVYNEDGPDINGWREAHIYAVVLGAKLMDSGAIEYVTWECFDDDCQLGHYFEDRVMAVTDYHQRLINKYHYLYGVGKE